MSGYKYDLPATHEQLEAIGMVASEWAYLESIVDTAIWALAQIDEDTGRAITTHVGLPNRLNMLRTLFRLRDADKDAAVKLDDMCDKIKGKLSRQRGEVVHAVWVRGDHGSPMTYAVRARGTLEKRKAGKPAKEIIRVGSLIAQRSQDLRTFLEANGVLSTP